MTSLPIAWGLLVGGLCAAIVSTLNTGPDELRAAIRATAFTSAVAFLPAFSASSLHRLRPSATTRWLMANRRYVGLSFAASHFWHLVAIVAFMTTSSDYEPQPLVLAFGGGGFVFVALMAATSNDASQRALGRGWGWLHWIGAWVIWLDFIFTYMGPATISPFHAVMTLAFASASVLRVLARAASRQALSRA